MASIQHPNKARYAAERINQSASDLLEEGKHFAGELRDEGMRKLNKAQRQAEEYSNEMIELIREHPVQSVLIAGGVGLILAALFKK